MTDDKDLCTMHSRTDWQVCRVYLDTSMLVALDVQYLAVHANMLVMYRLQLYTTLQYVAVRAGLCLLYGH